MDTFDIANICIRKRFLNFHLVNSFAYMFEMSFSLFIQLYTYVSSIHQYMLLFCFDFSFNLCKVELESVIKTIYSIVSVGLLYTELVAYYEAAGGYLGLLTTGLLM